ncbi:MAG: hypothetical protein LBV49_00410 [Azonexus sp.]|jgi:hypothetical protein|nr:hypothetical protein [Azonexus sp.]
MKFIEKTAVAAVTLALAGLAQSAPASYEAPTLGGGDGQRTDKRVYAGLQWTFGGKSGFVPQVVIGARSLKVKSSDSVSGGEVSLRLNIFNGFGVDSLRAVYVGGKRDIQGNLGGGYSFADGRFLGTAAAQGPYSRLGADYLFGSGAFRPYIEVNSLKKPAEVKDSGTSCRAGLILAPASNWGAGAAQTVNGQTCAPTLTPPV